MALTLQIILVLSCLVLTMFVLLHKGKGGGLSSLFGGGVQSNLSGSTVTILTAIVWLVCIIGLNLIQAYAS